MGKHYVQNTKKKGCCMIADARARMDEINEIYTDLLTLKQIKK